jgi:hypothetical protein
MSQTNVKPAVRGGTGTNAENAPCTNIHDKNIADKQFVGYIHKTL